MAAIVLILLFRPLAITYHRWELQVANIPVEFHEQHNVPDLVERFGPTEEP